MVIVYPNYNRNLLKKKKTTFLKKVQIMKNYLKGEVNNKPEQAKYA